MVNTNVNTNKSSRKVETNMKRSIAAILALLILSALMAVGVSAADFVPSADQWEADIDSAELDGEDVSSKLVVTPYKDRTDLPDEKKDALEKAYTELTDGVAGLAGEYKIGSLMDISYDGPIPSDSAVTLKLELNNAGNVKAILCKNETTGEWERVEFTLEESYALATFRRFGPVAILVGSPIVDDISKQSPQTGDSSSAFVAFGALVVCTAAAAAVILRKRSF